MLKRIPLSQVKPNPDQPRKTFDPQAIEELAASIEAMGLMQPITVRPMDGAYMIVAGERRWRAHCHLAETGRLPEGTILAQVRRMDDETMAVNAILENLQRVDISPMEEAQAFDRVLQTGVAIEDLAKRLGRPVFRLQERLQLLRLSPEVQILVKGGHLPPLMAWHISFLEREADQAAIVRMISSGQLKSADAVKAAVDRLANTPGQWVDTAKPASKKDLAVVSAMERRVSQLSSLVAAGWTDGECTIASQVNPDKAGKMADELALIRRHILHMEKSLQRAHGARQVEAA
ncbi:MAG: ParB/RepB/Spo0J family partition protein [Devosia sp.]